MPLTAIPSLPALHHRAGERPAMANQRPDYDVFVSQKTADGKNYYTRVGAAWAVSREGISIKLAALPIDGNLVLFPHRSDNQS